MSTEGRSINDSGAITGIYFDAAFVEHGFVRDPEGSITSFDAPNAGGQTYALSISASGTITGSSNSGLGFVRDPQGNITSFAVVGTSSASPNSINASGAVTGSYSDSTGNHGLVGTAPNGMDISKYTRPKVISSSVWQNAIAAGVSNVMVQAWGGLTPSPLAASQLAGAQGNSPPLNTGAYFLLSYFENLSPEDQIKRAADEIGGALTTVKIMAVDVEQCCGEFVKWRSSTPYLKGAQIMDPAYHIQAVIVAGTSGSTNPAWNDAGGTTTDGNVVWRDTGHVFLNQGERIDYINRAVSYIQAQYPAVKVVIYTSGGKGGGTSWTDITGNCGIGNCPDLIALPLWDVEHRHFTAGDGLQHCGDGVADLVPFTPSGPTTWQTRGGDQYDWGYYTTTGLALEQNPDPEAKAAASSCIAKPEGFFGLVPVDLDYFDPLLFQ